MVLTTFKIMVIMCFTWNFPHSTVTIPIETHRIWSTSACCEKQTRNM